jgi:hypothetical protein
LLISGERSKNQIFIILTGTIMLQDVCFVLNTSRNILIQKNLDACVGVGFIFHFSIMAGLAWYAVASVNLLLILGNSGRFKNYSYVENKLLYHIVAWGFVLIDILIVWGLRGLSPSTSFGAIMPWSFCWISSPAVLLGVMFVPALIIMTCNVIVTVYLGGMICWIRFSSGQFSWKVLSEVFLIAILINTGTVALGVVVILLLFYVRSPAASLVRRS